LTFDEAKEVLAELARNKVEYILIGSMAMAAQGLPRATRDMDFFVKPGRDNVARLKQALRALFDDPHIDEIDADELAGAYPALEYVPPHGRYSMDILTRLGETFRFEDIESEELRIDDFIVRVATPRMLYRMKKDTVRPQDRADAARIRESFGLREE
jgi:hypothetical protein